MIVNNSYQYYILRRNHTNHTHRISHYSIVDVQIENHFNKTSRKAKPSKM